MDNNQEWQYFLQKLQKDNINMYELLKETELDIGENLTIYHPTEEGKADVGKQRGKIQAKLVRMYPHWQQKKLIVKAGKPIAIKNITNPLQSLVIDKKKLLDRAKGKDKSLQPLLEEVKNADKTCEDIYSFLTERTKTLSKEGRTLEVKFSWRLRVGGMRGFQELLLPVFHPVYGIPYVPAGSLKGATRAWARQHGVSKGEINRLLGELEQGVGCIQILDAFPKAPCLSVDMANPQWVWEKNRVRYDPKPHPLLSMQEPELVIGLVRTHRGKRQQQAQDLETVETWLKNALAAGIGSRVSAGYGRTQPQATLPHSLSHSFKVWTQGMYGANTKEGEFRHTAVRGVLRYWFRAVALGLYSVETCQELETQLFGALSKEGSVRIGINLQEISTNKTPYFYEGSILLESKSKSHLLLVENVLKLLSNIGGVGRGSRRPLHWNDGRMRGCHWELDKCKLSFDKNQWQKFLESVINSFIEVYPCGISTNMKLSDGENRYQDVLNSKAKIFLVPSVQQKHPQRVNNWSVEGYKKSVLGEALDLLYSSPSFKGKNRKKVGNPLVGGTLGTPSFVIIKSIFPSSGHPYQVVTIFGANHPQRDNFVRALPDNSIQVWPL
ncbi:MAG: type III-B CRISPR module RAMP protein Cmr1 [Okeania sp. SIO2F4]|uniref:type III-B CRISPR module RAMP protein Cmr1 n=1 Tax=Okeania sp. SIO2F4 TaxID=2607790 RepID=UPI00142C764E|nr:type III-B CRISPR module RAMP protein Cmr1 [Okeania sp. SIO2F4]NES01752.1 type III-B CRISPR module RAMP protein Cmr1 [Okeania sp. SIO2F4]